MRSVRIGDKKKSVRVKSYIIDFYATMMKISKDEALKDARKEFDEALKGVLPKYVNGDIVANRLLVNVTFKYDIY